MDLKQLETFRQIVRLGSFSAAAAHLNTSQPAVSARVRALEASLGAHLFERAAGRAQLTAKGRELQDYAERLLDLARELRIRVGDRRTIRGFVRLGVVDAIAFMWLSKLMDRVAREYPGILLELHVDHTYSLCERLAGHGLDLVCCAETERSGTFQTRPLGALEHALMASSRLRLPAGRLTPADVRVFPIIGHTRGTLLHRIMCEWFQGNGLQPPAFHTCTNVATVVRLTLDGIGIGVLPVPMMVSEIESGALRVIPTDPPVPTHRYVVAWQERALEPAQRITADLAAEIAQVEMSS